MNNSLPYESLGVEQRHGNTRQSSDLVSVWMGDVALEAFVEPTPVPHSSAERRLMREQSRRLAVRECG